jgi:hypothetical protein
MNLDEDVHKLTVSLLRDRKIAAAFWKLGPDAGLGQVIFLKFHFG